MFLYRDSEYCHEGERHRQPVPEQSVVVRVPVIVGWAEASQKNAEEKNEPCSVATKLPQAHGTDHDKGKIWNDIPEIRDAEQSALICKLVITGVLRDRWKQ